MVLRNSYTWPFHNPLGQYSGIWTPKSTDKTMRKPEINQLPKHSHQTTLRNHNVASNTFFYAICFESFMGKQKNRCNNAEYLRLYLVSPQQPEYLRLYFGFTNIYVYIWYPLNSCCCRDIISQFPPWLICVNVFVFDQNAKSLEIKILVLISCC